MSLRTKASTLESIGAGAGGGVCTKVCVFSCDSPGMRSHLDTQVSGLVANSLYIFALLKDVSEGLHIDGKGTFILETT